MKKKCVISDHLIRFYPDIPEKLMNHIKDCADCVEELDMIKLFAEACNKADSNLLEKTNSCPDDNLLAAYLDGNLRTDKLKAIKKHLLSCPYCFHMAAEFVKENYQAEESIELLLQKVEASVSVAEGLLKKAEDLSKKFIAQNYPTLEEWFNEIFEQVNGLILSEKQLSFSRVSGMGFAGKSKQVTAKTILIIHNVLKETQGIEDSKQIKKIILKHCKRYKANRELRDALIEYLQKTK